MFVFVYSFFFIFKTANVNKRFFFLSLSLFHSTICSAMWKCTALLYDIALCHVQAHSFIHLIVFISAFHDSQSRLRAFGCRFCLGKFPFKFCLIYSLIHCKSKDILNVIALASTHIAIIGILKFVGLTYVRVCERVATSCTFSDTTYHFTKSRKTRCAPQYCLNILEFSCQFREKYIKSQPFWSLQDSFYCVLNEIAPEIRIWSKISKSFGFSWCYLLLYCIWFYDNWADTSALNITAMFRAIG